MFWPPSSEKGRPKLSPSTPPPVWEAPFDPPKASDDIRERAYRLARQELPDAPVEDVMCRAEKIAAFLANTPST